MTGLAVGLDLFTLTFDSSPIKGEGDSVGCFDSFTRVTRRPSGLRIRSAMTCVAHPCEFHRPVDTALKPV